MCFFFFSVGLENLAFAGKNSSGIRKHAPNEGETLSRRYFLGCLEASPKVTGENLGEFYFREEGNFQDAAASFVRPIKEDDGRGLRSLAGGTKEGEGALKIRLQLFPKAASRQPGYDF